jgi:mRNA-degrading endonuclease YafQ of YafQ-DinJ toxin-antitoxin module
MFYLLYYKKMFKVNLKNSVKKSVKKLPKAVIIRLAKLVSDLKQNGPIRPEWPNYSRLKGTNAHHCHLTYDWVACWVETQKGITIEVTYAGSREGAPYA